MEKKTKLEVSFVEPEFQKEWDEEIKPQFEKEYPWIELESVKTGYGDTGFNLKSALTDKLPQIVQVDENKLYFILAKLGKLLDVKRYQCSKDVDPKYLDPYTIEGVCFGIPEGNAFASLFVNMGILKKAGWDRVPENWDEFEKCCEDIKNKTDSIPVVIPAGMATISWAPFETILVNAYPEALSGGKYEQLARSGEINLSDYPKAAERLQKLASFTYSDCCELGDADTAELLKTGKCAMAVEGSWVSSMICDAIAAANGDDQAAVRNVAMPFNDPGALPIVPNMVESGIGVTEVDDADLAKARDLFFEWIFMPEHYAFVQKGMGNYPVLNSMKEEQLVLTPAGKQFLNQVKELKTFSMANLSYATVPFNMGGKLLADVFAGEKTADRAIAEIDRLINIESFFAEIIK